MTALDVDLVNARLPDGADLCAYEETAPDLPGSSEAGWEPSPYLACADGSVTVATTVFESGSGRSVGFNVDVQLFEVLTPFRGGDGGAVLDPLEGLDDCEVVALDGPLEVEERGNVWFLEAPEAAIAVDDWQWPLDDFHPEASSRTYSAWLGEVEMPRTVTAGDADLTVLVGEGGTAPAMELEGLVQLPPALEVTTPSLQWDAPLPRDDVEFAWTGTSDRPAVIHLNVREAFNAQTYPIYDVRCEVVDDGAWTLPAAVMEQLPAGWVARLEVIRGGEAEWVGTMNGSAIRAVATASHVGANVLLTEPSPDISR